MGNAITFSITLDINAILETGLRFLKEVQSKVGIFNSGFTIAVFRGSGEFSVERYFLQPNN